MNNIEAAITKEINDMCSLPCYGATNATEEEQQRGRLAGLTWALNLVVQTQSKAGRHDVDFWREVVHLTKERDALQKDVERLTEAARSVLIGFDQGVFVRSIQDDSNPLWALRLLPFIRALATLQHLLGVDGGALGDAHEVTTPANHKEQSIASAPRGGGETRPEIPKK